MGLLCASTADLSLKNLALIPIYAIPKCSKHQLPSKISAPTSSRQTTTEVTLTVFMTMKKLLRLLVCLAYPLRVQSLPRRTQSPQPGRRRRPGPLQPLQTAVAVD